MRESMVLLTPINKIVKPSSFVNCYTGSIANCILMENKQEKDLYISECLLNLSIDKETGSIVSPLYKIVNDSLQYSNLLLNSKKVHSLGELYKILEITKSCITSINIKKLLYNDFFIRLPSYVSDNHFINLNLNSSNGKITLKDSYIPTLPSTMNEFNLSEEFLHSIKFEPIEIQYLSKFTFNKRLDIDRILFQASINIINNSSSYFNVFIEFLDNIKKVKTAKDLVMLNSGFVSGGYIATRLKLEELFLSCSVRNNIDLLNLIKLLNKKIMYIRLLMMKISITDCLAGIDILKIEIKDMVDLDFKIIETLYKFYY